jgi:regulator of replication initiation timing
MEILEGGVVGNKSAWVGVLIALLVLLGSGVTAYTDVKSEVAVLYANVHSLKEGGKELDTYDALLSQGVDNIKERLTRTEAEQNSLRRTQEEIKFTMGELLKEMKQMNENIIRLGVK